MNKRTKVYSEKGQLFLTLDSISKVNSMTDCRLKWSSQSLFQYFLFCFHQKFALGPANATFPGATTSR